MNETLPTDPDLHDLCKVSHLELESIQETQDSTLDNFFDMFLIQNN